jgi:hypothetical protein
MLLWEWHRGGDSRARDLQETCAHRGRDRRRHRARSSRAVHRYTRSKAAVDRLVKYGSYIRTFVEVRGMF